MTAAYLQPFMVLTVCWVLPAVSILMLFLFVERGNPST
jgi:hypothetical protein